MTLWHLCTTVPVFLDEVYPSAAFYKLLGFSRDASLPMFIKFPYLDSFMPYRQAYALLPPHRSAAQSSFIKICLTIATAEHATAVPLVQLTEAVAVISVAFASPAPKTSCMIIIGTKMVQGPISLREGTLERTYFKTIFSSPVQLYAHLYELLFLCNCSDNSIP